MFGSRLTVRPVRSRKYDPCISRMERGNADKRKSPKGTGLHQLLILKLPAHRHQLLVQLMYTFSVKFSGHLALHTFQLLTLPLAVKDLSAILDFIFSHLSAEIHSLFKQFHDLVIYRIQLFS